MRYVVLACFVLLSVPAEAQDYSSNMVGSAGLNSVPSARTLPDGSVWAGGAINDPYFHGFAGFQISQPFSIVLRQSAEISSPVRDADHLYPGMDFKWRLYEENENRPQIAAGVQSAMGHARMGGEYLVASKRYKAFDFTAGLGWGRFASAFKMDNPLKILGSHFSAPRDLSSEMPVRAADWLTGDDIGLFGGVEYFTGFKGVSLKADIGGNTYEAEQRAIGFDAPVPWALGANYHTALGQSAGALDIGLAVQGKDRIMARVSLSGLIKNWKKAPSQPITRIFPPRRTQQETGAAYKVELDALRDHIVLDHVQESADSHEMSAELTFNPAYSLPSQVGAAAVHMAANAAPQTEKLTIHPAFMGLRGGNISVMRRDLENVYRADQGSAAEIWANAEINEETGSTHHQHPSWWTKRSRFKDTALGIMPLKVRLDEQVSLAEEEYVALHRSAVVAKMLLPRKTGYLDYGAALRVNVHDNLRQLSARRASTLAPVRSDVADYASSVIGLDEAYVAFTHSFKTDLHIAAMSGYLEEMFAGTGGEVLYRPFKSRFAVGGQGFMVMKRDTDTALNLGLLGPGLLNAQVNAYYDMPYDDLTLKASVGRFLGGDHGARIGFAKLFDNGAQLSGDVTLSDQADPDPYGGETHADYSLRLSLPLGGFKYIPDYVSARINAQPFGRDIGQSLDAPLDLYELTTPFSLPHIAQHWDEVITPP